MSLPTTKPSTPVRGGHAFRSWTDENTGRTVRQLTYGPTGGGLGYFRHPRHLPGGLMLFRVERHTNLINPDTGAQHPLPNLVGSYLKLRKSDGRLWTFDAKTRQVWAYDLPGDTGVSVGRLPDDIAGYPSDITCDGRRLILLDHHDQEHVKHPAPTKKDAAMFWHYIARPRRGAMRAYDLHTGTLTTLVETDGYCPFHTDTSPLDPTLVRFAHDRWEGENQRVWSVRTDGSELKMIRPQQAGELVTHEFWWSDGVHVGYTYQDRRQDPTRHDLPWCEYSPAPTQLGIADPAGRQVYLSDPVNHYHTHLYVSRDGAMLSGSGTDGHSFVHAARFDMKSPKIDYVKLATVHTPYVPFRGQYVNCDFSADGKWLLYSDTIDGVLQLCAVEVKL